MTVYRIFLVFLLSSATALAAQPQRPAITGIADIAFRVSDLEAARNFYGHVLGFDEFSVSPGRAEGPPAIIFYKVNDHQYIEISPGLKDPTEDRLIHIGFETTDARQLRDYLASRGVQVPAAVAKDVCGNLSFTVQDPDGHAVEFVQYLSDSIQSEIRGDMMPATHLSSHILHVGIRVWPLAKANEPENRGQEDYFYRNILGFRPMWEGGPPGNPTAWLSELVPDGSDWVELMQSATYNPTPRRLASMNHVCLEIANAMDIQEAYQKALARGYTPPGKPMVARDGRWLENFYDPDGTRIELMIRKPVEKPCCTELHDPYIQQ